MTDLLDKERDGEDVQEVFMDWWLDWKRRYRNKLPSIAAAFEAGWNSRLGSQSDELRSDKEGLLKALAECVDAYDEVDAAISSSAPIFRETFQAAQRRRNRSIDEARKLCVSHLGSK